MIRVRGIVEVSVTRHDLTQGIGTSSPFAGSDISNRQRRLKQQKTSPQGKKR